MENSWVYKADGTLQCGLGHEISLKQMRGELAALVGAKNILAEEKRRVPEFFPQVCGAPTGQVNAYELTAEGTYVLFHGIVGPSGFRLWLWPKPGTATPSAKKGRSVQAKDNRDVPWPLSGLQGKDRDFPQKAVKHMLDHVQSVEHNPVLIRELIGYFCRVIAPGDMVTDDFVSNRVNIRIDEHRRIISIYFG